MYILDKIAIVELKYSMYILDKIAIVELKYSKCQIFIYFIYSVEIYLQFQVYITNIFQTYTKLYTV